MMPRGAKGRTAPPRRGGAISRACAFYRSGFAVGRRSQRRGALPRAGGVPNWQFLLRNQGPHTLNELKCSSVGGGTSKTTSCCGWWNWNLKVGDKACACPRCGVTIDRQVNGARGNLLAALGMALKIGWDGASG